MVMVVSVTVLYCGKIGIGLQPPLLTSTWLEVLAVKAPDGTIRTAFNTCQVCYGSGRGLYRQHFEAGSLNVNRIEDGVFRDFRNRDYQVAVGNDWFYHVKLTTLS